MEERSMPSITVVAEAFVKQYYSILKAFPERLHKFYKESSVVGWPEADGVVTPVTSLSGIKDEVMSSDYKCCLVEIKTTDAQEAQGGGIIITVTGCLTGKDDVKKNFTQTFFLATQKNGFYISNDLLRVFDVCVSMADAQCCKRPHVDDFGTSPPVVCSANLEGTMVEEAVAGDGSEEEEAIDQFICG